MGILLIGVMTVGAWLFMKELFYKEEEPQTHSEIVAEIYGKNSPAHEKALVEEKWKKVFADAKAEKAKKMS